jgi:hypothetical protein
VSYLGCNSAFDSSVSTSSNALQEMPKLVVSANLSV